VPAPAGEQPPSTPAAADRLAAIQKEYKEVEAEYRKAMEALPDTPEGQKKARELYPKYDEARAARFLAAVELARADPKSEVAFAALEWVLTIPRAYYKPAGKPALELVTEYHATNPKVGRIVAWVGYYRPRYSEAAAAADALITAVAEKNPDRTARGQAFAAIAWEIKSKFAAAEYQRKPEADRLAAEADKAFEALLKDYGDCPRLLRENFGTLGDVARSELVELRQLRIGKPAPDIEGEDLDGVKFKLSDYRGKVIVLDFWGDW
jgi:hypothetical protein